ncbi:hypothetical protein [Pseudobacteriovorax antillogorgiicola]|uniref:Lipoprotein n=1 Tax=Pseudobacteriovorax antillogorgiicola TaxID=1513793 RepID=A0A1Y6BFY1_9BACT|nr:hypothetical protein [Pseudobacteriovorax antillogorgiicola]TCS57339.1 hypothetical protein EDD56_10379 [Pseudobacteriovorax antillogorgiicola]SMF02325.1 hypothetical protein SAMN06296036_103254 [Pseudobacteriovorax antillogorgiicola]
MKRLLNVALSIGTASLSLACDEGVLKNPESEQSQESTSNSDSSVFEGGGVGDADGTGGGTTETQPELQAVQAKLMASQWTGRCFGQGDAMIYLFDSQSFAEGRVAFQDANCQTEPLFMVQYGGIYDLESIDDAGLVAWQGELLKATVTLYYEPLIDDANSTQLYGFDDWVAGESKDVTGQAGPAGDVFEPREFYSTLQITQSGELAFGSFGLSPDERSSGVAWSANGGPYRQQP